MPSVDAVDDHRLSPEVAAFFATCPRSQGGLMALGSAAHGALEMAIGRCHLDHALRKRADAASALCPEVLAFARAQQDDA
eukprot:10335533-Karenia_brevis.AAC.1